MNTFSHVFVLKCLIQWGKKCFDLHIFCQLWVLGEDSMKQLDTQKMTTIQSLGTTEEAVQKYQMHPIKINTTMCSLLQFIRRSIIKGIGFKS